MGLRRNDGHSIFCQDPGLDKALPQALRIFSVGRIIHPLWTVLVGGSGWSLSPGPQNNALSTSSFIPATSVPPLCPQNAQGYVDMTQESRRQVGVGKEKTKIGSLSSHTQGSDSFYVTCPSSQPMRAPSARGRWPKTVFQAHQVKKGSIPVRESHVEGQSREAHQGMDTKCRLTQARIPKGPGHTKTSCGTEDKTHFPLWKR